MAVTGTFVAAMGMGCCSVLGTLHLGCRNDRKRGMVLHAYVGSGGLAANPVAGILCRSPRCAPAVRRPWAAHGDGRCALRRGGIVLPALVVSGLCIGYGYAGAMVCAQAMIARQVAEGRQATALALQQNAIDVGIASASALYGAVFSVFGCSRRALCLPGMSYRARRTAASEALGVPWPDDRRADRYFFTISMVTSAGRAARRCSAGSGWRPR